MEAGLLFIRDLAVVLLVAALVGALFRKMGLSPVVGYLVAGMIVGPNTPPISLVTDPERVRTLSQLGLVFLMFFVGLELSLRRIRQLGAPLFLAVATTACLVFVLSRGFAGLLGWGVLPGLFLAAMLTVSSTAIISKTIAEAGLTHEKFAQRALGASVLEDIVAVVLIALLGAQAAPQGGRHVGAGQVLLLLGGFVALLGIVGILIVPRFLRRLVRAADLDLRVSALAGLLLAVAFVAAWAGYSVALGAFLLGLVVAETPFRDRIERGFSSLQAMFSVIFFVSIGMLIDVRMVAAHWGLILGLSAFAVAARFASATGGHLFSGRPLTGAVRTALLVTPLGEFSYVIAQLGVETKAVPDFFYSVAVGVSAVTAFSSPLLLKASDPIAEWVEARQPGAVRRSLDAYRAWLDELARRRKRSNFWLLTRGRLGQVAVELLLLVGVLGFSPRMRDALGALQPAPGSRFALSLDGVAAGAILFWAAVFCIALGLAVAVWRNLAAVGMIVAEAAFADAPPVVRAVFLAAVRFLTALGLAVVVAVAFPLPIFTVRTVAILAGAALLVLLFFRRRLVRWHSRFLYSVNATLQSDTRGQLAIPSGKSVDEEEWGVDLVEVVVPEGAPYAGKNLRELALRSTYGCAVVELDRQGFEIANPAPDTALYPGDRLLILGDEAAVARTRTFLEEIGTDGTVTFDESALETVTVPAAGSRLGRSLAELRIFGETGVQVLGIRRDGQPRLNPAAGEVLHPGDRLLVLANPAELRAFRTWLEA